MNAKSVVISDKILKNSKYSFSIKYEDYTNGCIVFGIEKEEKLMTSNYWGSLPMVCMSCNNMDAINFSLT
jgi:hypothetical protein